MKKHIISFFLAPILLSACQTSAPAEHPDAKALINPYTIGYYIGYSELCSEYQGESPNPLTIKALVEKYGSNSSYKTGFQQMNSLKAFDRVSGLKNCRLVHASLEKTNANLTASGGVRRHYSQKLSIDFANRDEDIIQYVAIEQIGGVGTSGVFEVDEGRECTARFEFANQTAGNWKMTCTDKATGKGTFSLDTKTLVTTGTGSTSFGGDVSFKMKRL